MHSTGTAMRNGGETRLATTDSRLTTKTHDCRLNFFRTCESGLNFFTTRDSSKTSTCDEGLKSFATMAKGKATRLSRLTIHDSRLTT